MMANEIEEKFNELSSSKSVRGVIVLDAEGATVKSNLDQKTTDSYADIVHEAVKTARRLFAEADPSNDLTFVSFRTKKYEMMVVPDKKYLLVVIHHPQE